MESYRQELHEYLLFAIDTARAAGENLLSRQGGAKMLFVISEGYKGLVSDADLANRDLIIPKLVQVYPNHRILTEESGRIKLKNEEDTEWEWIVDECDGTNNYMRGDPHFSVSIGLRRRGKGVVGVVYAPALRRLYYAAENQGAFVEAEGVRQKLQVSGNESINMFTMSFAVGIDFNQPEQSDNVVSCIRESGLFRNFRRRMLESTALELCYVAEGRFDAHYNNFAKPWDIAAGEVIVQEAGGSISRLGDEILLASNGVIHEGLVKKVQEAQIMVHS